jgi:polar amino acid transport system substrate-binding protein
VRSRVGRASPHPAAAGVFRGPVPGLLAWTGVLAAGLVATGRADELDLVRARGALVWAADQEGGGPHVFPDPERPERLTGFEVELADLIAAELGVRARFQQGQWDRLPLLLDTSADCVINGYELLPERQRDYRCSRPYFAYALQLVGRRGEPPARFSDLERPGPGGTWRVGVLSGSAAETVLRARPELDVEVIGYDGTTDSLQQLAAGVLDAVVMDDCIFAFYADRFASLRAVDRPFAGGVYTVLTSQATPRLAAAIDEAIGTLVADGRLKALYDRWDLAGRQQMLLLRDAAEVPAAVRPSLADLIRRTAPLLVRSAGMTLLLACASFPLAVAIGLAVAVGRLYGPAPLRPLLSAYVETLRGTPLMLQLYAIFFLLPQVGLALPALAAAILGLALNYSAYEAEIYRAGLKAVPAGQFDAALSLGLSRWQALRHVVVPQAVRIVMPPVTSDFIALFKDTSVCSVITVVELTKRYSVLALSTGRIVELALVTALLYLAMSWPLALLSRWFEHRLERPAGSTG